jgi:Predicted outer membrane protein
MQTMIGCLLMATAAAFLPATGGQGAKRDTVPSAQSFLKKAAEGQQAEIAMGRLASERAGDEKVKQFGALMMEDHRKASKEIQLLALKEGVVLPTELTGKHQDKREEFAQLAGDAFDRAYIRYMLRDHRKDVKEFERQAKAIKDPQVQRWAEGTLPLLKQHLQTAQRIASSIGIETVR